MTEEKKKQEIYEWIRSLVITVAAAVVLFMFILRPIRVDGESMRETLQDGDLLMALCGWLCGDYEAGDIVIVSVPTFKEGRPIVKRVIATGGQTVDIDFDAGIVYVDDEALEEDYIRELTLTREGLEFPVTLEENEVFVMGDNRNHSTDSRSPDIGPVNQKNIIGRAEFLLLPGKTAEVGKRELARIGLVN